MLVQKLTLNEYTNKYLLSRILFLIRRAPNLNVKKDFNSEYGLFDL